MQPLYTVFRIFRLYLLKFNRYNFIFIFSGELKSTHLLLSIFISNLVITKKMRCEKNGAHLLEKWLVNKNFLVKLIFVDKIKIAEKKNQAERIFIEN